MSPGLGPAGDTDKMPPGLGPDSFQKSYSGELSFCVGYSVATSIDVKVKRKNNRKKNNFGNLPNASILC